MAKQYREYTPNEIGLNKRTNWRWFRVDIGQESLWFSNGHIAMNKSPVREFPVEIPKGAEEMSRERRDAIRNPENGITPFDGHHMVKYLQSGKELCEVSRTERGAFPGEVILSDWDGNGIRSAWTETTEIRVSRSYYSFLKKKYPKAVFHAPKHESRPVVLAEEGAVVAILMPMVR